MSRIVKGQSSEVAVYQMSGGGSRMVLGRKFYSGKVEGTFSKNEVDGIVQTAQKEATAAAIAATEKRMMQPLQDALANVELVLTEVSKFRSELFKEASEEIFELVRTLGKKVVLRELQTDPEILRQVINKSLEIVEREKQIVINFSPADLKVFEQAKEDFLKSFGAGVDLRVVPDPQLISGQVTSKSENMQVDVGLEKMVDHLLRQVEQSKINDRGVNEEGENP